MQQNSIEQHDVTADLVRDLLKEKRSERRWKNIRFFLIFLVIAWILMHLCFPNNMSTAGLHEKDYIALVRLEGSIGPDEGFSAKTVVPLLTDAFKDHQAKGVVLDINSGGGTPVQASIIHDAILELKNKYHKKVVVVGEDMLASGAYYVAVAADKIYVNPSTLTGSIGVIMKEFGFPELIKKWNIERRVYTSGVNKDRLDPFLPQTPEDVSKIRQVIGEVHENFRKVVEQGRPGKLQGNPDELFSGDFWSGSTALKLGLVDALGNLNTVLHNEFQVSEYKDYSEQPPFIKNMINELGSSFRSLFSSSNQVAVMEKIG